MVEQSLLIVGNYTMKLLMRAMNIHTEIHSPYNISLRLTAVVCNRASFYKRNDWIWVDYNEFTIFIP